MTRNTPKFWDATLPIWDADQDDILVCCQIRQETADVKSFFFRPEKPALFKFLPGQFITLELTIDGKTINRCYTISSSPSRPHTASITVKRQPNGVVSNWLHDHLKVGSKISVLGAAGEFSCVNYPAKKYLFMSGGSGITPLMSMARAFQDLAEDADIAFVHSARTPADIIFRQELDLMAFNQPHFKPAYICEKADANWTQPTGYLNLDILKTIAPDFLQREVFTCGPAPYMAAVRALLGAAGFNMQHYHEESFTFDELPSEVHSELISKESVAKETQAKNGAHFSIQLSKSGVTIDCAPNQFVLDATLAAGLRLASSCRKGLCGTCKTKLISGKVDMKHGGGIRQREIDQGLFLPCCSKPLSDLVMER
jgi:glycine betaine catabolism B